MRRRRGPQLPGDVDALQYEAKRGLAGRAALWNEARMDRPAPYRLDPDAYPFSIDITPRYGDLDPNRHINNVAAARFFEEGRVRFQRENRLHDKRAGGRTLVAAVSIAYLAEGDYPAPVTVAAGFGDIGRTSWSILLAAFQDGRCFATCDSVVVGRNEDGAMPITGEWRAVLDSLQVKRG
jgi:acyl-CoA thioester hydrolase